MSVSSRNTKAPQRTITSDGKLNLVQSCLDNIVNNIDYWTTYLDPLTLNKSKWIITPFDVLPEPQRFIPALISRLSKKSKLNERTLGVFLVHNLETLSITAPFVNDGFIELICRRCPALRQLDVSGNKTVSNLAARTIAWFCQNITHLNIARTKMTEEGVLLLIHKYQSNLKSLDVSGLPITNTTVKAIADNCSGILESLNISSCENIGDEGIAAILAKCHALHSLNASVLWSISDFGLFDLGQCKALTDLDLSSNNVSAEVLAPILQSLPALERLSLSDCQNVALHNVFAALAHCQNLHFLNIGHPPRGAVYHGIHALTGLTELRARSALDEYSLPSLRSLTALQVLDLSLNRAVDDETLTPLAALSSLRKLDFRQCEYMTSQGLAAVLQANTQLQVLDIGGCLLVDMPSLINALTALKELREVNLMNNKTLTVKHVNALLAHLPLLERIVITHCPLIPTVQGSKWQEQYKHIEWIY